MALRPRCEYLMRFDRSHAMWQVLPIEIDDGTVIRVGPQSSFVAEPAWVGRDFGWEDADPPRPRGRGHQGA